MQLATRSGDLADLAGLVRAVAAACDAAYGSARGGVDGWEGPAAVAAGRDRAALLDRVAQLRDVAGDAAEVFARLARQVQALEPVAAAVVSGAEVAADPMRQLERAAQVSRVEGEYAAVSGRAAARLVALAGGFAGRPLSLGDHVGDFAGAVWDGLVVGTAAGVWGLTGQLFTDPGVWWANVRGVPVGVWEQARDPAGTVRDTLAVPDWEAGRYGAGLGGAVAGVVGLGRKGLLPGKLVPEQFRRNVADPGAPRPPGQTFPQMLGLVDLRAHEHADLGHTIRRHVDVTDDYLRDRVTNGTLLDTGGRGTIPAKASAFTDMDTAELAITMALEKRRRRLEAWLADPNGGATKEIHVRFAEPIGRIVYRANPSARPVPGATAVIRLARDGDRVYIKTAFVEP